MSLADQVGVMIGGRILQIGPPEEVYAHPASLDVAAFVGDVNMLSGEAHGPRVTTELGVLSTAQSVQGPVKVLVRPEGGPTPAGQPAARWAPTASHGQGVLWPRPGPSGPAPLGLRHPGPPGPGPRSGARGNGYHHRTRPRAGIPHSRLLTIAQSDPAQPLPRVCRAIRVATASPEQYHQPTGRRSPCR